MHYTCVIVVVFGYIVSKRFEFLLRVEHCITISSLLNELYIV